MHATNETKKLQNLIGRGALHVYSVCIFWHVCCVTKLVYGNHVRGAININNDTENTMSICSAYPKRAPKHIFPLHCVLEMPSVNEALISI